MKTSIAICISLCMLSSSANAAVKIVVPQDLQSTSIQIIDPDRHIKTLGEVAFQIDLSAAHDDLLALKVRRSDLTLRNGKSFTAFGVHKDAEIIVLAGGETSHVSIASAENKNGSLETSILFYGKNNAVISPSVDEVAVFDIAFNRLSFIYTPMQAPGSIEVPVSIALDISGSMGGHMKSVVKATKDFMLKLPDFTHCRVLTFNAKISHLTPREYKDLSSCPSSAYVMNTTPLASGQTALYKAIETGLTTDASSPNKSFPNIMIVVTDGINTVDLGQTLESLKIEKAKSNSKVFVFWAGNYKKGHLQGLADLEFVSTKDLDSELNSFFHSLGVSISGLQTLLIKK